MVGIHIGNMMKQKANIGRLLDIELLVCLKKWSFELSGAPF
jgi:hypothetical protein